MSFSLLLRRDGVNPVDYRIDAAGRLVLSTSADTVRDRLWTALSTQFGEWFLDDTDGVPYLDYENSGAILGGKMTEAEVSAILRRRILLDPEVNRVVSMQVLQDAQRRVSVTAEVFLVLYDGTSETITLRA